MQEQVRAPFRKDGLGYVYEPRDMDTGEPLGVRFKIDYLMAGRQGATNGDLVIESLKGRHIFQGKIVVTALYERKNLGEYLQSLPSTRTDFAINWRQQLDDFCSLVLRAETRDAPFEQRGKPTSRPKRKPDLLEKLIPGDGVTTWFAKGGTGKGWFAALAAFAVMHGQDVCGLHTIGEPLEVAYLDWEDSGEALDERLWAIAEGLGVPEEKRRTIHYKQMFGPLAAKVPALAKYGEQQHIALWIHDSVGMAMGGGDGGNGGESAVRDLFRALKLIPGVHLLIDHVAAQSQDDEEAGKKSGKAFGSAYKMYLARTAWELMKEQVAGEDRQTVAFLHAKHNHTKQYKPIAIELLFEGEEGQAPDRVYFAPVGIEDTERLVKAMSLAERIQAVLRHGPQSVENITEAAGESGKGGLDKVRNALNRGKGRRFEKLPTGLWTLQGAPHENHMVGNIPDDADALRPFRDAFEDMELPF